MPRFPPRFGAAILCCALLPALCPTSSPAQTWWAPTGYNDLFLELGGLPVTEYGATTFVGEADTAWRYRKGVSEPPADWNTVGFNEATDTETWTTGQTPVGYGDGDDNTVLGDMFNGYTSVYLRRPFTVPAGGIPARLLVRAYVDDGAIIWINGQEVDRFHVTAGPKAYNDTASNHEAEWEGAIIGNAGSYLVEGNNVIAIHALNQSITSSDFSIDAAVLSPALRVTQVEANPGGTTDFLPQTYSGPPPSPGTSFAGAGNFSAQTLFIQSTTGVTYVGSSHAANVGNRFYGASSFSNGVALADCFDATGWLNGDFLRTDAASSAPRVELNAVQNHSWIATLADGTAAELNDIIRRHDHAIARDGFLAAVGLNNGSGTTVPTVFGSAYNVISVGRTDGSHSRGGTIASTDGPGRIKPDIVAPDSATSFATPQVGSAACLLLANANSRDWGAPFTSYVIKAILMAGATKDEFASWTRSQTQPIDTVYGAGELNLQHSYHILDGGERDAGTTAGNYGWDKGSLGASGSATYTLQLGRDVTELSCILTWNRTVDSAPWLGGGAFAATVADMTLQLHRTGGPSPALYDSSNSPVDNVEHVYLRGLTAGTYTLTVATDVAVDFGLAWRADEGDLPELAMSEGATAGDLDFAFSKLAVGKGYSLESSGDMATWSPVHVFTATATTANHSISGGLSPRRTFYRLIWDPVN